MERIKIRYLIVFFSLLVVWLILKISTMVIFNSDSLSDMFVHYIYNTYLSSLTMVVLVIINYLFMVVAVQLEVRINVFIRLILQISRVLLVLFLIISVFFVFKFSIEDIKIFNSKDFNSTHVKIFDFHLSKGYKSSHNMLPYTILMEDGDFYYFFKKNKRNKYFEKGGEYKVIYMLDHKGEKIILKIETLEKSSDDKVISFILRKGDNFG